VKPISASRKRPLREEVYELLKKSILTGECKPGDWLREEDLSRKLEISRTPIREAFRKLEMDGFIKYYSNKGSIVSEIYTEDLDDIYDLRALVESRIARKAAARITPKTIERLRRVLEQEAQPRGRDDTLRNTDDFNTIIFEASKSVPLTLAAEFLRNMTTRVQYRYPINQERREKAREEHLRIVEALEKKDGQTAADATYEHLMSAKRFAREHQSAPDED